MPNEWKPIETSPKDGKPFVAWSVTTMDEHDEDGNIIRRGIKRGAPCIVYWVEFPPLVGGDFVEMPYRLVSNRVFTHWMPLPPPPESEK